jgi:uncharacterized membrane protein YGL010W
VNSVKAFVIDYCQRHANPVNAFLHIFGVPAVFIGLYDLFARQVSLGCALIVVGYILQYLGHRAQGNEVGEVTLIKKIWRRFNPQGGA